jgi:endonuclease/exonuclease/phosphatase family metal-dependent hydrolase
LNQNRFKVGSFNLYNLVLPGITYYGHHRCSDRDYQKKTAWIAGQLRRMDADIVGFQEIFHSAALQEALRQSGQYEDATVLVGNETGEGPVVGLVSRFKVLEHGVVPQFPVEARLEFGGTALPLDEFSRPVLWANVEIREGIEVVIFVVHLKSKNPMIRDGADPHDPMERAMGKARSLIRRAAEASALRHLLLDVLQGRDQAVMAMGDVNDAGNAVTSEIVSGSPPWRKLPFEKKLPVWDVLLYNVKDIQARQSYQDVYYTHIHNGHYENLDHIFVSQEFVRQNNRHLGYVEYVSIFDDHLIDKTLSDESVPPWQSDHGQVVVTIRLRS